MTTPTNVEFVDQTTIISEAWLDGVNDWVNGAYGVLGETFTAAAFKTAIGASAPADIQAQTATAFTTGGTSTAFTLTPTPAITSLVAGQRFRVKFNATAGAAPTLAISGLAATALKLYDSAGAKIAASSTSIIANMLTDVEYDGTNYVILDPLPSDTSFSSSAENIAGTIENKAVDPLGIREAFNATGSAPVYACRAWGNFNGTGVVAINASGNISSITDNGVGDYTINFSTPMQDANYAAIRSIAYNSIGDVNAVCVCEVLSATTSYVRISVENSSGARYDAERIDIAIFR